MKKNRCVEYLCLGTVVCFIIIGLVFGWQRSFFVFGQQADSELLGQYGDFVGGILGTIFALVSIYFVYKTFYQQLRSFQRQNKTFLAQQQATELQRFNDLFATLSNLLEQAEQRLNASINANFFDDYKNLLQTNYQPQKTYSKCRNQARLDFWSVYASHKTYLAIYFRTLYRIFDLIDNGKISEENKIEYAKIMRAQLTESQLFFLRYNAMLPLGHKFTTYINKYNILKHLPIFELLEFKNWWTGLSLDERNSIEKLFKIMQHNIRHGIDFNLPYQAHRKYAFKIEQSISRSELSISIIINTAWSPVTRDTTDTGLDKLFSQNVTKLETLLDCFLKEIIIVSNFNQLNNRKDLSFEIEAYKLDAVTKYGIIKVCVKNTKQQPIIYSYQY